MADNQCYDKTCIEEDSDKCVIDPAKIGAPKILDGEVEWNPSENLTEGQVELIKASIAYINKEAREGRVLIRQDGTVEKRHGTV